MMSDHVPEAADTLAVALPQPTSVDDATAMISDEAQVPQKHEDASPSDEKMDEDDKENVVPTSENVVAAQSPGGPGTPTKRKHKSGRIGKRELLQVASPKARWLPRVQEKRRGRSINRFEFEEKEVQPLWEGEGRKLEDSALVVDNIKFFSRNDTFLKQVHQIFYNRACKANEVKANLIAFSGLPDYYQGKAQEKLEAKSVSFLKLLADVLGVAHGEDGKKKTLVADLVAFLAAPRKVRRGVNLADKAEALKEQRRAAREKKERKAKRTSTGGKDKTKKKEKKKDGTKKKPKAKASDFYSDIESDDDEADEDMAELYKWDKKTQTKNEAEAKQTLDRIAEREAAEVQKKLDKKKNKNKRKASDEDDESDDESEDEKAKAKRKKEKEKEKKRKEAEKKRKAEKEREKRRRKKAEEEERKKRKIVKAKRKHEERAKAAKESDEGEEEQSEEEEKAPKATKRTRAEVSGDEGDKATAVTADAADGEAAKAQAHQEGSSRKRRKIAVASEDEDDGDHDEVAAEVAAEPAADTETNKMQVEEKKGEEEQDVKKAESEEEKERKEKTQEAIKETLRRYLKEQLTMEEARLQTPKLLRLHVEAALGHSVEEHSAFILQCVRQLFTAA